MGSNLSLAVLLCPCFFEEAIPPPPRLDGQNRQSLATINTISSGRPLLSSKCNECYTNEHQLLRQENQGPLNQMGRFPDLDLSFLIFPGFSRFVWGLSGDFPDWPFASFSACSLTAPTRNSPERVRDTIRTFPEKKWETPRFGTPPGLASPKKRHINF